MSALLTDNFVLDRAGTNFKTTGQDVSTMAIEDKPSLINNSGRFSCFTDNRWVTGADNNYGVSKYSFSKNSGTGTTPVVSWNHMGVIIPAGRTVRRMNIFGAANNNQIADMEFYIAMKYPLAPATYETGFAANSDITHDVIYNDTWLTPAVGPTLSGAMKSQMGRTIAIDYTVPAAGSFGQLMIYARPVGTITTTRYFRTSYTWEIT